LHANKLASRRLWAKPNQHHSIIRQKAAALFNPRNLLQVTAAKEKQQDCSKIWLQQDSASITS
jgi:hypothetical protein